MSVIKTGTHRIVWKTVPERQARHRKKTKGSDGDTERQEDDDGQRRCCRDARAETGRERRRCRRFGACPRRQQNVMTPRTYKTRSVMSSRCSSMCAEVARRTYLVSLTTRAAAFSTRSSFSVVTFGTPLKEYCRTNACRSAGVLPASDPETGNNNYKNHIFIAPHGHNL